MLPRGAWAGSGIATVTNALSELRHLPASMGLADCQVWLLVWSNVL